MGHASVLWAEGDRYCGGAEQNNAGMTVPVTLPLYPFPGSGTALLFRFNGHDE
jgi:hypothetical protein